MTRASNGQTSTQMSQYEQRPRSMEYQSTIFRRLLSPAANLKLSCIVTEMHSQGHSRAQIWQPVQTGSPTAASHNSPGGPWKRGASGIRSFGYWTVTGLRKSVRKVV